jgi:hypothetical protein
MGDAFKRATSGETVPVKALGTAQKTGGGVFSTVAPAPSGPANAAIPASSLAPATVAPSLAPVWPTPSTKTDAERATELKLVVPPSAAPSLEKAITPNQPASASTTQNQNVNVAQTLNFNHPGTDVQKTADSHKRSVNAAYRQMNAQGKMS